MRNFTSISYFRILFFSVISGFLALGSAQPTLAGSATWNTSPTNSNWNTAVNWTPLTVPNAPVDTATFGPSNLTDVSLFAPTEVGAVVFGAGAAAFTISPENQPLTLSGAGVTNNSAVAQTFVVGAVTGSSSGAFTFQDSAIAGNASIRVLGSNPGGGFPA